MLFLRFNQISYPFFPPKAARATPKITLPIIITANKAPPITYGTLLGRGTITHSFFPLHTPQLSMVVPGN